MKWFLVALSEGRYLAAAVAALALLATFSAALGTSAVVHSRSPWWTPAARAAGALLLSAFCAAGLVARYTEPADLDGTLVAPALVLVVILMLVACLELGLAQGTTRVWSRVWGELRAFNLGRALELLRLTVPGVLLAGHATAFGGALVASNGAEAPDIVAVLTGVALAGGMLALLRGSDRRWRWIAFAAVAGVAIAALVL